MAQRPLKIAVGARIDAVCLQFEAAWQRGDRPKIDDFLDLADVVDRGPLRSELLRIEVEYRRKQGEQITSALSSELDIETIDHEIAAAERNASSRDDGNDSVGQPTRFGRYQVTGLLGEGAFGVVYHGFDPELRRDVAIKVPRRQPTNSAGADDAYLAEARTVATLDHMGIVPVLDVGRGDDGICYVVSKYMPGGDLASLIDKGRPSHDESVELIAQIADALHYAHQRGLVHRDIKPANILLDEAGRPLVVDFGLALNDEAYGSGSTHCGTPAYMSPEQARGEGHRVDARSDIYSLGVVFYELLTGRRPYRHAGMRELLDEIASDEIRPPRQLDDTIPKELERICLKALARRTEDRYTTAFDLAEDLRIAVSAGRAKTRAIQPTARPSNLSKWVWATTGAVLVFGIGLFGRAWITDRNQIAAGSPSITNTPANSTATPASSVPGTSQPLHVTAIDVRHFANTPDGDEPRGLIGQGTFTPSLGDRVQVTAKLSKPGYAYLIAFRPDGQGDLCFPPSEDTPPLRTETPRYPLSDGQKAYGLREGTGLWVFAVVASETPLPSYRDWLRVRSNDASAWNPVAAVPRGIVWWDDGQTNVEIFTATGRGDTLRGKDETLQGPAQTIKNLTDSLRGKGETATASAIGFCVTPGK